MCASHSACRKEVLILNLSLTASVVVRFPICLGVSHRPQRPCILVDFWLVNFDRSMQLHTLAAHVLPFGSRNSFADGLTNGLPVLTHERWPHLFFVSHIRGVDESAQCSFSSAGNVSSPDPSRTTASKESVANFGFTTGLDCMFSYESPTSTAAWLSTMIILLSHSIFSEPTLFWQALYNHLDWAVVTLLLVCQELEHIEHIVRKLLAVPRALETLLHLGGSSCCLV